MELQWLGHSCFKLTQGAWSLVIDPYEPGAVPGLKPLDLSANAVLCSHDHHDHNWAKAVTTVKMSGDSPFRIERIETFHDDCRGAKRGKNTIHIISSNGVRAAHLGDLGCMLTPDELSALGRLDALMIPVGGFYTINARQAFELTRQLDVGAIIPMHYRSAEFGFDVLGTLTDFTELFEPEDVLRPASDTAVIMPGEQRHVEVLSLA